MQQSKYFSSSLSRVPIELPTETTKDHPTAGEQATPRSKRIRTSPEDSDEDNLFDNKHTLPTSEVTDRTMTRFAIRTASSSIPTSQSREYFCAPAPNKYRDRLKSTCLDCFSQSKADCVHYPDTKLKLVLIGHNPSTHVWLHGYNYGNPTNRMWKLLTGELGSFDGVIPLGSPIELQNTMPSSLGIGLTDLAHVSGSDAAEFPAKFMHKWIPSLFARLKAHVTRVNDNSSYRAPAICAFTGKRQFTLLFSSGAPPKNVPFGRLPDHVPLPPNWPFERSDCQIWILPSSSGRAAMTHEQRFGPYKALAEEVRLLQL